VPADFPHTALQVVENHAATFGGIEEVDLDIDLGLRGLTRARRQNLGRG
jgi:hypothetical protein